MINVPNYPTYVLKALSEVLMRMGALGFVELMISGFNLEKHFVPPSTMERGRLQKALAKIGLLQDYP